MPDLRRAASVAQHVGLVLALLPVALLPQLVGGVHPEAAAGFALVELLALSVWWMARAAGGHGLRVTWLALPFVVGAAATLLQLVPLPEALLDALQSESAALRRFVREGLPAALQSRVAAVTSLDPAETKAALLRLVGAAALVTVVADAMRDQRRARLAWRLVLAAGALLFISAALHAVVDAAGAWGRFSRFGGWFFAPVVNPNHLSKLFGAFSLLALGRAISAHGRVEAVVAGVVFVACGAGVGLTLSRGGILAFGVALVVFSALWWRVARLERDDDEVRRAGPDRAARFAVPALALSAVLLVVVGVLVVADDRVMTELSTIEGEATGNPRSKLSILAPALALLDEHALVGVGNNGFGVAFTRQSRRGHLVDDEVYFSHPENIVVAALVEHGVVVGGALLLLGLVIAGRLTLLARSKRLLAALPAAALLLVGDLVDFALETGAGLALMAAILGLASSATPSRRRLPRALAVGVVGIGVVVVAMSAPGAVAGWRYHLDRALREAPLQQRTATLHAAIAARPFDGWAAARLATDARQRHKPQEALAWANRALNLWPTLTTAHVEAARALAAMGRLEQAMLSYREAASGRINASRSALQEALSRTTDVKLRERALPDTAGARAILCAILEQEGRLDDALACADVLAARSDASAAHRLEPLRLATRRDDVTDLRRRVDAIAGGPPPDGDLAVAVARAMVRLDGREVALRQTAPWVTMIGDPRALLAWRLREQQEQGALDDARATLALLRPLARSPADVDRFDQLEAELCAKAGDHGQRVVVLQRLAARNPGNAEFLARLGLAEVAAGRVGAAHQTLRRVREASRPPPSLPALERALGIDPR